MAEPAAAPEPSNAEPYHWDPQYQVGTDALQLWSEVGAGLDKNQTVVWKSAVESLRYALQNLDASQTARQFVEAYAGPIIGILVEQSPGKIGPHERNCVQESLQCASLLVAKDLDIQNARGGRCLLLETVLNFVFNKKKSFYKKGGAWQPMSAGFPEVRIRNIEKFRAAGGFSALYRYLMDRVEGGADGAGTHSVVDGEFPSLDTTLQILNALQDSLYTAEVSAQQQNDCVYIAKVVSLYLKGCTDDQLKTLGTEALSNTLKALQRIFDKLVGTRRPDTVEFYSFWRELVLHMIQSPSLPLKLAGWEQVHEMIKAVEQHRPPPRRFVVSGAGCPFVNGKFEFAGNVTELGYAKLAAEISYVLEIPDTAPEGAGKKLTLFRCTMRSQQKFWFLSEADEEQPGTDRDIDYYQHKSKEHEEAYPPPSGWITCRNAGVNPPPNLHPDGLMVPPGQEMETLEHQLAKWAIENSIVEDVLGDTTIHREVVARSTTLMQFLASMCSRDDEAAMTEEQEKEPNKYCLQTSHLLYAWKTCLRKADAAVSNQVYQLLVSIIPLCPSDRAIPLLRAIQTSLHESSDKRDHLFEVSEFCTALAGANLVEVSRSDKAAAVPGTALTEDVREEVLNLLWSVLTHPGVSSLKSYDNLKRYVTHELQVEPRGSQLREHFLQSCVESLTNNARITVAADDEVQALRMVKLTRFILEACPRDQADGIVLKDNLALPLLLFNELVAYLERRRHTGNKRPKPSLSAPLTASASVSNVSDSLASSKHNVLSDGLEERLKNLRHVYGLSSPTLGQTDPISMTSGMLHTLWTACVYNSDDREAVMVFMASASHAGKATQYEHMGTPTLVGVQSEPLLSPAFPENVCRAVFLDLFCAPSFDCDKLGERGYRSFQFLFRQLFDSKSCKLDDRRTAVDALWKVCLTAGNDTVVKQAMKDLLSVYVDAQRVYGRHGLPNGQSAADALMAVDEISTIAEEESFGDRMFQCLERVKVDLESSVPSADRSVERCMRILNAAIGRVDAKDLSSAPTLGRLTALASLSTVSLDDAMKCLPHGLRGQACYRRVGIVVKRPNPQSNQTMVNYGNSPPQLPPTAKFSLDIHPLETMASIKYKVSLHCQCLVQAVKPIQITGRTRINSDGALLSPTNVPEDTVMDELGVVQGCEMIFLITERQGMGNNAIALATQTQRSTFSNDLSNVFFSDDGKFADRLFSMVLGILESLPWKESVEMLDAEITPQSVDVHKLVWDLLLAMPTNESVATRVKTAQWRQTDCPSIASSNGDPMEVDSTGDVWAQLLDARSFDRSVYVLLTIDAFLQPAPEALSIFPAEKRQELEQKMVADANAFRRAFIEAGGFAAVAQYFSASGSDPTVKQVKTRRGNAVALRILKSCLFGGVRGPQEAAVDAVNLCTDEAGAQLLQSLADTDGLLKSLTAMVVDDRGVSVLTITDVLRFLRLLFQSPNAAQTFVSLPNAERFLVILLMWDEGADAARLSASVSAALHVRRATHDLVLKTPVLADRALPWLVHAIDSVDVSSESTVEYFDALEKLIVSDQHSTARSTNATDIELQSLAGSVCKKLVDCPRPGNETDLTDISTGVLCGCLKILRALIEHGGGTVLRQGTAFLLAELKIERWSELTKPGSRGGVLSNIAPFSARQSAEDVTLVDLMGAIFDGFLSPSGSSPSGICCDKESRSRGFDVVGASSRACESSIGYMALIHKINSIIGAEAPKLCHRWGQFGGTHDQHSRHRASSKYTGLRNQGCTCYMNSFLQQLFMMSELRASLCSAPLPKSLRMVGSGVSAKGSELVGKKISLHWDNGAQYEAMVKSYNSSTGMHTIRYLPLRVMNPVSPNHPQIRLEDIAKLPPMLFEEFFLSEGRPGMETGAFEIRSLASEADVAVEGNGNVPVAETTEIKESEDESSSRHLLEEVQRTFIHLEEGSRGHCFDPRALVEACACLKLEFDVGQQNDASEFATKLLDRLEISLKKWAPKHFDHMDHTFGLKQTKQKICKKCGLKSNREEKLLNIDCQIRGKSDIHEALSSMTEVEIMEGSNQVYCDSCKENTDTILKSAISMLPNMLILSLKRFDLDYNTFETVKLNSRCAFGHTLNMKQYSLDAVEAMEAAEKAAADKGDASTSMEMDESQNGEYDPLAALPDEDYEYRLVGVLVHAGVAQGGHYYSFIKDRACGSEDKWFRFDDDDVTPFDPASIETECFGGKVKKESKWPNGQVHTVEQEQFANALMLFYEKMKKTELPEHGSEQEKERSIGNDLATASGYDVFEPDVRQSNETYQWQSFLFDQEFQGFLRGMLSFVSLPKHESLIARNSDDSWRIPLVHMLLSFVFDVMFYSAECNRLNEWSGMLESIMQREPQIASEFVQKLAQKTREVSANWLRTFLIECPDPALRIASVRIFNVAIKSCEASEIESKSLENWCRAWRDMADGGFPQGGAIPCALEGKWYVLEDVQNIGHGASSLGRILSFTNEMLEVIPRYWRFSPELCIFIRFLSSMHSSRGESYLRRAIMDCQMPSRLVALIAREPPTALRGYFPGASVSHEIAVSQMKQESNPLPHAVTMNSNQVLNNIDLNGSRLPTNPDYMVLLEALACLIGLPMVLSAPVIRETEDMTRNRGQWYTLTDEAMKALSIIFEDACKGSPGMGHREIESYLKRCGIDQGMGSQQKIHDMLTKYPTTVGKDSERGPHLSLEGFIAYYRDCSQTNDVRLRSDLHTFGFRPNLSRRSRSAMFTTIGDRETMLNPISSVAVDVAEIFRDKPPLMNDTTKGAFGNTVTLYTVADSVSEPLMLYLAAASTYRRHDDTVLLIDRIQTFLYKTPNGWEAGNAASCASKMLQVFAAIPGADQETRIQRILLNQKRYISGLDFGCGILSVLQGLHRLRQSQQYTNEVHWTFGRYLDVLKDLHTVYPVFVYLSEHRDVWSFVERELQDSRHPAPPRHHGRLDYGPLEQPGRGFADHNNPSDSDIGNMQDSEDEDEDSRFDTLETLGQRPIPNRISVIGAGNAVVDGVYALDGFFEHRPKYVRDGLWGGERFKFYIFLCNTSNNMRHWYISIVPYGGNPGTSSDIDFYTAPMADDSDTFPPTRGWLKTNEGKDPSPTLEHVYDGYDQENSRPELLGNGTIVEDDDMTDQRPYV